MSTRKNLTNPADAGCNSNENEVVTDTSVVDLISNIESFLQNLSNANTNFNDANEQQQYNIHSSNTNTNSQSSSLGFNHHEPSAIPLLFDSPSLSSMSAMIGRSSNIDTAYLDGRITGEYSIPRVGNEYGIPHTNTTTNNAALTARHEEGASCIPNTSSRYGITSSLELGGPSSLTSFSSLNFYQRLMNQNKNNIQNQQQPPAPPPSPEQQQQNQQQVSNNNDVANFYSTRVLPLLSVDYVLYQQANDPKILPHNTSCDDENDSYDYLNPHVQKTSPDPGPSSSKMVSLQEEDPSNDVACSDTTMKKSPMLEQNVFNQQLYNINSCNSEPSYEAPGTSLQRGVEQATTTKKKSSSRLRTNYSSFPYTLYLLLEEAKNAGFEHIISWQSHGRAFRVHDQVGFVENVMPLYFQQTRFPSFQRQLAVYGFLRMIKKGEDQGAYYHKCFIRGYPQICNTIQRTPIKGTGKQKSQLISPEPDFYCLPPPVVAAVPPISATSTIIRESNQFVKHDTGNLMEITSLRDQASAIYQQHQQSFQSEIFMPSQKVSAVFPQLLSDSNPLTAATTNEPSFPVANNHIIRSVARENSLVQNVNRISSSFPSQLQMGLPNSFSPAPVLYSSERYPDEDAHLPQQEPPPQG